MTNLKQQKRLASLAIKRAYPDMDFQISLGRYDGTPVVKVGVYNEEDVNAVVSVLEDEIDAEYLVDTVHRGELYNV